MPFFDGGFGLMFILFPVVLLGMIVLGVVALASRRGESDPNGRRPLAIYLLAVMFVTLFVAFGAIAGAAEALVRSATGRGGGYEHLFRDESVRTAPSHAPLVGYGAEEVGLGPPPSAPLLATVGAGGGAGRDMLEGLVVALVAGAVFLFHGRRLRDLLAQEAADG